MQQHRYEILDGLRGIAAIMVVIFHISEAFSYDPVYKHLNHGYLCVDFFFVLSGFIIGHAYLDRLMTHKMTPWSFIKTRLIRLQPMVFFGIILGALLFYFQESPYYPGIANASLTYLAENMLSGFLMIPITPETNVRANGEMLLLNIPQWSMVFEYIANLAFCLIVYRIGKKSLSILTGIFALLIIDSSLTLNIFGLLQPHDYPCSLNAGWSFTTEQFYIGIARVGWSFFTGLLIYRMLTPTIKHPRHSKDSPTLTFAICSLIIIAVVCTEQIGGYEHPIYDGIFNLACVMILFPFTVYIGAKPTTTGLHLSKTCDFLGRISYPLYLSHYPIVYLFFSWIDTHHDSPFGIQAFASVSTLILSLLTAYAAMTLWDEPVRKALKKRCLMRF